MARLEKAWMTFGVAMFLLQLLSLIPDLASIMAVLVVGLFMVGCGLSFATLFKILHRFGGLLNIHFTTYKPKVLVENDVDKKSQVAS
jgi:hypothetical protein